MIFVTVGTHTAPFDRLIGAMDAYAASTEEAVTMQIGAATEPPRHAAWFRFAPYDEMQRYCLESRVVVCQGAMSMLVALQYGAAVVTVPRRRALGEHIDDHQVVLVARMAERGLVTAVEDVRELSHAIEVAAAPDRYTLRGSRQGLVGAISQWLESGSER